MQFQNVTFLQFISLLGRRLHALLLYCVTYKTNLHVKNSHKINLNIKCHAPSSRDFKLILHYPSERLKNLIISNVTRKIDYTKWKIHVMLLFIRPHNNMSSEFVLADI